MLVAAREQTEETPREITIEQDDPRRWAALPVILTATFMALFDVFVVNVAAPSIQRELGASDAALQLVVGGYAFTYAAGLVTGGRLGDRFGYRRVFMLGMALFVLTSVACGLAQDPTQIVVARLCQGAAAALMVPQVLAFITRLFPPDERSRALAWFGVAIGLGSVAGQILGGVLLQADLFGLDWRVIFLVNLPVGAAAIAFALRLLPDGRSDARPKLDGVGIVAISGSLALALFPLTIGRQQGWPAWAVAMLIVFPVAFALALRYEARLLRRGGQPLLDLELFRWRSFRSGLAINMAIYAYFGSFLLGLALFLQAGLHFSALHAGLTFGPVGVAFAVTSLLVRPLIDRRGRRVVIAGVSLSLTGAIALLIDVHFSGAATSSLRLFPPLLLIGVGNGCALPAMIGAALVDVPRHKAGAGAGALSMAQQFAISLGVAVLGEVFFTILTSRPTIGRYVTAVQAVFMLNAGLLALALVLARFLPAPATAERA